MEIECPSFFFFAYPAQIDSNWTETLWKLVRDGEHRHAGNTSYGRAGHVMFESCWKFMEAKRVASGVLQVDFW